jgi:hypothetical protein
MTDNKKDKSNKEGKLSPFEEAMRKIMNTSKEDVEKAIEEDKLKKKQKKLR